MPEGQIRLKGAIEPGVVAEMLQMLSGRQDRLGFLRVTNRRIDGRIWFKEGAIVAAECGSHRDIAAICRMLRLNSGEFSFVDTNLVPTRSIFDDTTSILLESYRQIDENKESEPDEPALDESAWPMRHPASPQSGAAHARSLPVNTPVAPPKFTPRPQAQPQSDMPAAPIHRPAAPWAGEDSHTSSRSLSLHPLPTAPTVPAAPAAPVTPTSAAKAPVVPVVPPVKAPPRPMHAPYRSQPPPKKRKLERAELILVAVVCIVVLGVSGVLLWRVLDSRRTPAAAATEETSTEPASPRGSGTAWWRLPWFFGPSRAAPAVPAPETENPTPATAVNWPTIRLSGLVAVPGRTGSAVINGRMVLEGQMIEGVVLDMVTRTGVVLRSGDATRFVSDMTIGNQNEPGVVHTNGLPVPMVTATNEPPAPTGFRGLLHQWFGW